MSVGRRVAALLVAVAALGKLRAAGAQTVTLAISAIVADSTSPAPFMTVTGFPVAARVRAVHAVARHRRASRGFAIRSIVNDADGNVATFNVDSLMPERATVYFRARLIDAFGTVVAQATAQHPVRSWLRLVSPIRGPTTVVTTQSPEFVWDSPPITCPAGTVAVRSLGDQHANRASRFLPGRPERNVVHIPGTARGQHIVQLAGARARGRTPPATVRSVVSSPGTIIIASPGAPIVHALLSEFSKPVRARDAVDANLLLVRPRSTVESEDHDLRHSPARSSTHPARARRATASSRSAATVARTSTRRPGAATPGSRGTVATTVAGSFRKACISPCSRPTACAPRSRSCSRGNSVRFTTLGTGTISLASARSCAGYLVETPDLRLLIDCGSGITRRLAERGSEWQTISHVALTHFHIDHHGDLPSLIFAWKYGFLPARSAPVEIIGPPGTAELLGRLAAAYGEWLTAPGFPLAVREITPDSAIDLPGGVRLTCHPVPHTPESVAYSIERGARRIVYTGDTGPSDAARDMGEWLRPPRLRMFAADGDERSGTPDP